MSTLLCLDDDVLLHQSFILLKLFKIGPELVDDRFRILTDAVELNHQFLPAVSINGFVPFSLVLLVRVVGDGLGLKFPSFREEHGHKHTLLGLLNYTTKMCIGGMEQGGAIAFLFVSVSYDHCNHQLSQGLRHFTLVHIEGYACFVRVSRLQKFERVGF